MQFPIEMNTRGRLSINTNYFQMLPCTILCVDLITFTICSLMFALHNELHIYGFSDVNLLDSAPGTVLHL